MTISFLFVKKGGGILPGDQIAVFSVKDLDPRFCGEHRHRFPFHALGGEIFHPSGQVGLGSGLFLCGKLLQHLAELQLGI